MSTLLAALLACSSSSACLAIGSDLRVMSFNVRADFDFGVATSSPNAWISTTGNHRRDLATAVITQYAPDVLGVQEAFSHQVADLDSGLSGYGHYGIGRNNGSNFGEQSAIFYRTDRFVRLSQGTFWLSNTPDQPSIYPTADTYRIASWVILRDDLNEQRELFVLNTHWATGFSGTEAREYSAQLIRDRIETLAGERPRLVMGDLNAFDFQPAIHILLGADQPADQQLLDSYRQTHPEKGPNERTNHGYIGHVDGQRLDYILHDRQLRTKAADIVHTNFDGSYPSDHYPVTADVMYVTAIPGDYNNDGRVSLADYTLWRDKLGGPPGALPNDFTGGPVGAEQYATWKSNFAASAQLNSSAVRVVPEPGASAYCLLGSLLVSAYSRHGRRRMTRAIAAVRAVVL